MQGQYAARTSTPAVSFGSQAVSQTQAHRIVMSSVARSSKVTPEGMVSRDLAGRSVSNMAYAPYKPDDI